MDIEKQREYGRMGGRPWLFTTEELQQRIDNFFNWCDNNDKPYTLARLAVFLDTSLQTLWNWGKNSESPLFEPIKKATALVLADKNERLIAAKGSPVGLIFDLKNNHGWQDKQDIGITGDLGVHSKIEFIMPKQIEGSQTGQIEEIELVDNPELLGNGANQDIDTME